MLTRTKTSNIQYIHTYVRTYIYTFLCFVSLGTIITKLAAPQQEAFCVSQFESCKSVVTVQRVFCGQFNHDPPNANNFCRWHSQFAMTGCLCKGKSVGQPRVSEENVQRIRNSFLQSPKKSVRKASRELGMPVMTVWKVLRKCLHMCPYHLQLLQALKPTDYAVRSNFALEMQQQENDVFLDCVVFSDESTFHLNGKVNTHSVRIWRSENPSEFIQFKRDTPKLNVFCALSQ